MLLNVVICNVVPTLFPSFAFSVILPYYNIPSLKCCLITISLLIGKLSCLELISQGVDSVWTWVAQCLKALAHTPSILWVISDFMSKSLKTVNWLLLGFAHTHTPNKISFIHSLQPPVHSTHHCQTNLPSSPASSCPFAAQLPPVVPNWPPHWAWLSGPTLGPSPLSSPAMAGSPFSHLPFCWSSSPSCPEESAFSSWLWAFAYAAAPDWETLPSSWAVLLQSPLLWLQAAFSSLLQSPVGCSLLSHALTLRCSFHPTNINWVPAVCQAITLCSLPLNILVSFQMCQSWSILRSLKEETYSVSSFLFFWSKLSRQALGHRVCMQ